MNISLQMNQVFVVNPRTKECVFVTRTPFFLCLSTSEMIPGFVKERQWMKKGVKNNQFAKNCVCVDESTNLYIDRYIRKVRCSLDRKRRGKGESRESEPTPYNSLSVRLTFCSLSRVMKSIITNITTNRMENYVLGQEVMTM